MLIEAPVGWCGHAADAAHPTGLRPPPQLTSNWQKVVVKITIGVISQKIQVELIFGEIFSALCPD